MYKYIKRDLECAYIRYRSQSLILEEIAQRGPLSEEEILSQLILSMNKSDKNMMQIAGPMELAEASATLINLGLLNLTDEKMSLTEEGLKSLRSGTFQNLSHHAFCDYVAYCNQVSQRLIAIVALSVSIIGIILSLRSVM